MKDARVATLAARASELWERKDWVEASRIYQELVQCDLPTFDRAKMLGNLMQCCEKAGLREQAIEAGEECLRLTGNRPPYRSNEEAMLAGVVKGRLARLQGRGLPWNTPAALLASYFGGAAIGAMLGSAVHYEGVALFGRVWTDFRYAGAGVGALVGFFLMTRLFYQMPTTVSTVVAVASIVQLARVLTQRSLDQGLVVLGLLFIPVIFLAAFAVRQMRAGRIES